MITYYNRILLFLSLFDISTSQKILVSLAFFFGHDYCWDSYGD